MDNGKLATRGDFDDFVASRNVRTEIVNAGAVIITKYFDDADNEIALKATPAQNDIVYQVNGVVFDAFDDARRENLR